MSQLHVLNALDLQALQHTSAKLLLAAIIFVTCFAIGYFLRVFLLKLEDKFKQSQRIAWEFLCRALANPVFFMGLFIGLFISLDIAAVHSQIKELIPLVRKLSIILACTWAVMVYIGLYEKKYSNAKDQLVGGFDQRTADTLMKLFKAIAIVIAIIFSMDAFGVNLKGMVAVAGISGASLVFAAKDFLANFFGTISLYIDKPFSVGHKIRLPNGIEGEVEYVGWRVTKLRTDEKTSLYVVNSSFLNATIENLSKVSHKRITHIINLKFSDLDKVQAITKEINAMLMKHPEIDQDERIYAILSDITEYSIQIKIRAFTRVLDKTLFVKLTEGIIIDCLKIIRKHGASPAFPSRTIEIGEEKDLVD